MERPHAAGEVCAPQRRLQQATHRLCDCFVLGIDIERVIIVLKQNRGECLEIKALNHHAQYSSSFADGRDQVLI